MYNTKETKTARRNNITTIGSPFSEKEIKLRKQDNNNSVKTYSNKIKKKSNYQNYIVNQNKISHECSPATTPVLIKSRH